MMTDYSAYSPLPKSGVPYNGTEHTHHWTVKPVPFAFRHFRDLLFICFGLILFAYTQIIVRGLVPTKENTIPTSALEQPQFHSCVEKQREKPSSWSLVDWSVYPGLPRQCPAQTVYSSLTLSGRTVMGSSHTDFFFPLLLILLTQRRFLHETWASRSITNNQCWSESKLSEMH